MAHNFNIILWNVNGLRTRITDLHAHVMSHNIDILALQEVGVNGISLMLRGYKSFELPADISNNCRGLTTYVKDSIPAVFHSAFKINGTECLCVKITLKNPVTSHAFSRFLWAAIRASRQCCQNDGFWGILTDIDGCFCAAFGHTTGSIGLRASCKGAPQG